MELPKLDFDHININGRTKAIQSITFRAILALHYIMCVINYFDVVDTWNFFSSFPRINCFQEQQSAMFFFYFLIQIRVL